MNTLQHAMVQTHDMTVAILQARGQSQKAPDGSDLVVPFGELTESARNYVISTFAGFIWADTEKRTQVAPLVEKAHNTAVKALREQGVSTLADLGEELTNDFAQLSQHGQEAAAMTCLKAWLAGDDVMGWRLPDIPTRSADGTTDAPLGKVS